MNGCTFPFFDAGTCAKSALLGWIPDWVWTTCGFIHDYWSFIAIGLIVLGVLVAEIRIYRTFGWPGVIGSFGAATFILGYVLGKRSVVRATLNAAGQPTVKFAGHPTPVVVKRPQHVTFDSPPTPSLTSH